MAPRVVEPDPHRGAHGTGEQVSQRPRPGVDPRRVHPLPEHPRSGALDFDDMGPSWVHVRERARTATLHPQDKGVADVTGRFGRLVSFAAMRLSRELGVPVRPVLAPAQLRDPAKHLQAAVNDLAATGMVHGALRVPATVAPIKITADLRAGLVRCAVTVTAPREGRPTTRVNWLVRQLKNGPGQLCIEASSAWQHGKGPARTLDQAREDPKTLVGDPAHELRAFTLSLTSNAGRPWPGPRILCELGAGRRRCVLRRSGSTHQAMGTSASEGQGR